ncbi:hypothetical protein EV383_1222 [Pseudonocardia sediminis]|uniref:Transcriptional regulator, AbiEi antitoxin, Type IV TA system n=1 Tax=Pseudonocardia sediminis TaxID=1397368 RepID=A0A4Q7URN2_PSEST|nr:hypothetical protein EV383_1222 [Pseudonocardia sediminis]
MRVADLESLGLNRGTIAYRCRPGGPWQSVAPGVVALHNGALTRADRLAASLLLGGPGSVVTGLDALWAAGLRRCPQPSGPVHLLGPPDRRRTGYGLLIVERTDRLPPAVGPVPCAPVVRAVLDWSRRSRDRNAVRAALAEVVQRGRCTPAELVAELEQGCGRGSALPRSVLREVGDGVRSVAEARAREVLLSSPVLRGALWNPRLLDAGGRFVAMPDVWFDDVGMAWEIDSYEWHLSPADYERTLARRSAMAAHGIVVVHGTPNRLGRDPAGVREELERIHAQCRLRPRPALRVEPAPTGGVLLGRDSG